MPGTDDARPMKWLITGATGLLGANAVLDLSRRHDVVGVARNAPRTSAVPFEVVELTAANARAGLVNRLESDVVLHCAALSSVEACERDPQLAQSLNVAASADLATQAKAAGAKFVYISTDAVFDGAEGGYKEEDLPSPTSVYGRTKLEGEMVVLAANPDALVARVNFYGWSPSGHRSLAEFFYNRLSRGEVAPGFCDVEVSTMYVSSLVECLQILVTGSAAGVVHVASDEPISKFEFGKRLARRFGFEPDLVKPARSSDHLDVRRGSKLTMDTARLKVLTRGLETSQEAGMAQLAEAERNGRRRLLSEFSS